MKKHALSIMLIIIALTVISALACTSSDSNFDLTEPKTDPAVENLLNAVISGEDYSQYVEASGAQMATLHFRKDKLKSYAIKDIIKILDSRIVTAELVFEKEGAILFTFTVKAGKITEIN